MSIAPAFGNEEVFALLDDARNTEACTTCLYHGDAKLIECGARGEVGEVETGFARIDAELKQGRFVVGLFSFELGYALEGRLRSETRAVHAPASATLQPQVDSAAPRNWGEACGKGPPARPPSEAKPPVSPASWQRESSARRGSSPLLRALSFAYRSPLDAANATAWLERAAAAHPPTALIRKARLNMTREAYRAALMRVLDYIREGDTYQVNYTLQYAFDYDGHPLRIYQRLRERQRVEYGALIRLPDEWVLSLSPELFFKRTGEHVIAKPMKGTSKRGGTPREDMMRGAWLKEDEKNLAENVMIVDLIRNDLGRLAKTGSVRVDPLFEIEPYESLLQMTSTVRAEVPREVSTLRLLRELFPCGSITGAPKIRTMQIIRELEAAPRELYTGAIGVLEPNGNACFNVAIRTAVLKAETEYRGSGVMGVGSGVVADSVADDEFEECRLKGRFLTELGTDFELFESMRWSRALGCPLLPRHLQRLSASAEYFGFVYDVAALRAALQQHSAGFTDDAPRKVRLSLARNGEVNIRSETIGENTAIKHVVVAAQHIDARDPLYAHKTTRRALYDEAFARAQREHGAYEVLFFNQRGELAEGSRSNVILQIDTRSYTPPLSSGCLPGVMRAQLLAERGDIVEKALSRTDFERAQRLFVCNAVRGLVEVKHRSG